MGVPRVCTVTLNPTIDKVLEVLDFEVGGTFQALSTSRFPLGKGISVAAALATLGRPARVVALVGEGDAEAYGEFLDERDLDHHLVTFPGHGRSNTTVVDPARHTVTHVRELGPKLDEGRLDPVVEALDRLLSPGDWLALSGSLPPGLPVTAYRELTARYEGRGVNVALDSSGLPLQLGVEEKPALLKPNLEELAELLGVEAVEPPECLGDALGLVQPLLVGGVAVVALTMGAAGAVVASVNRACWAKVEIDRSRVLSTVGCGDAFLAGFLHGWISTRDLVEATRVAVAAGAANAFQLGAGVFRRADFDALLGRVAVVDEVP
ncbi:MAG: 1-phosphofructokinase [Promethearchaeota archaeon]